METQDQMNEVKECLNLIGQALFMIYFCYPLEQAGNFFKIVWVLTSKQLILLSYLIQIGTLKWIYRHKIELIA